MPYKGQAGGKTGHASFVRNPDISRFLHECDYIREPGDDEGNTIATLFQTAPTSGALPSRLIASDASVYSEPFNQNFPSTQIGYVKVSLVLVDLNQYADLRPSGSRFVDPFKVAAMHRNAEAITFTLPGSNIRYRNAKTVSDGFRRAVYDQFSDERTNFVKDGNYTLLDTLLAINNNKIALRKCPVCGFEPEGYFQFSPSAKLLPCSNSICKETIYLTDILRIHEQINDFGNNTAAITRFMNASEHLLMASLIYMLYAQQPETLSRMAFIVDGPLAIFGQPAKLHARIMAFYHKVCADLKNRGLQPPVIMGLQKDGQVMEHARSLARYLRPDTFLLVDDAYRAKYIRGYDMNTENFGHETYFGQDFIFKTMTGRIFVLGVPYPFGSKSNPSAFAKEKADISRYSDRLPRALDLIRHFECDLYENAVVPIALAHRHASISLVPGGKVLDLISKAELGRGA